MKFIIQVFTATLILLNSGCYAQHLIQKANDAKKIKENEQMFINKPLKNLLKEIKPQIKMVTANPTAYAEHPNIGYFTFRFITLKQYDSINFKRKIPITIAVYVKGPFEWEFNKRPKGKESLWTKEDEEKYGNLTIVGFRIYGEE